MDCFVASLLAMTKKIPIALILWHRLRRFASICDGYVVAA
jgi:hypothetical protein